MQEYAQKSMSTTLPRNDFRSIRRTTGGVQPRRNALDVGGGTAALQFGCAVGAVGQLVVLVVDDAAEVELAQLLLTADLLLQRSGVVGDRPLQHRRAG